MLAFRLLALLLGLTVALGTGEVLVRLLEVPPSSPPAPSKDGFAFGMGAHRTDRYIFREGGQVTVVPFRTNSAGFRDREWSLAKPPGVRRLAVLGDSFVAGMAVPQEAVFPRVLEEELSADGHAVETLGFGVVGYSTALELMLLEEVALEYSPDVVVVAFFQNDPADNHAPMSSTWAPYLRLTEQGELERIEPEAAGMRRRSASSSWLNRYSRLYGWQKRKQRALTNWLKWRLRDGPEAVPKVYHPVLLPHPPPVEAAWALTLRILSRMAEVCRENDVRLVVMDIPLQEDVSPARLESSRERYPALGRLEVDWETSHKRLEPHLEALGVAYLDLREPLRAHPRTEELYFEVDGHFTAAGHRFVGETLAAFLVAEGLIPPASEPGSGS